MIRDCDCDAECGLDECHFIEIARRVWAPTKSRNEEEKKKMVKKQVYETDSAFCSQSARPRNRGRWERERKKMQEKK